MHRSNRRIKTLFALLLCAFTPAAYAYIDPGVGSMLVQGLIAAFAAAAVTIRVYWDAVKNFFRSRKQRSGTDEPTDGDS